MSRESSIAGGRDMVNASAFAPCNVHPQGFHRIWEGRIKGSLKARFYGGVNLETLFRSCSNLLPFHSVFSCVSWVLRETDFLLPRTGDQISSTCHLLGWYLAWSPVKKTDVFSGKMIWSSSEVRDVRPDKDDCSLALWTRLVPGRSLWQSWFGLPNISSRSQWCVSIHLFSRFTPWVPNFSNYPNSAEKFSIHGSRCRENETWECPLVPHQELRVVGLFVLQAEFPVTCTPWALTWMSPQCQGWQSGRRQEGLIKQKLFPWAGRNTISWLENWGNYSERLYLKTSFC